MENYDLQEKDSFNVLGFGTELKSNYTDQTGLNNEKLDFWQTVNKDGRLSALKALATNDFIFAVNEAVNNKMMFYIGVLTEAVAPDARVIQFPKGQYLVVKGEGGSLEELNNKLTERTFGQVLPQVKNFAYVGGPNTVVEMEQKDGSLFGEMWIPLVRS